MKHYTKAWLLRSTPHGCDAERLGLGVLQARLALRRDASLVRDGSRNAIIFEMGSNYLV